MANLRITGMDDLRRALDKAGDRALDGLEFGVVKEASDVMNEARNEVPVDTGRLKASGTVLPPEKGGTKVSVEFGFGTDYAVFVHENLTASHETGSAKFLERPFLARGNQIPANLAAAVRAYLGRLK